MGPNETQLRRIINDAREHGMIIPKAATQMLHDARMQDLEARITQLEKSVAARGET